MENRDEIRLRIMNLERYLGRECTEEEKKHEEIAVKVKELFSNGIVRSLNKDEFLRIVKNEGLDNYVMIHSNTYEYHGEFHVLINKIEEYFTVLITGERGILLANSVFETEGELNYFLIEHMRRVKSDLGKYGYMPFKKKLNKK